MTEDATLDAFDARDASDGDADSESGNGSDSGDRSTVSSEVDGSADAAESPAVDPARSTFEWTPTGGECADCGGSAERRWRRDGQREGELVCPDCKDW